MVLRPVKLQPHMPPPSPRSTGGPLAGRRIVVTRAADQAGDLVRALEARGAEVVVAPVIRIEPLEDTRALRRALEHLADYRWIVFTSQNTVQVVGERLTAWGRGPALLAGARIAAIGPATAAALSAHGLTVEVLPEGYVAESLVAAIASRGDLHGARILLPRAEKARDALPEGLRAHGAVVEVIPVYRTGPALGQREGAALAGEILAGRIDVVTFTASSTVHEFVRAVGRDAVEKGRFAAAVIGPITAETVRGYGLPVLVEAAEFTTAGLVDALERHFQ
jgi:uroporphyrinogen III methyltransferase/synthase